MSRHASLRCLFFFVLCALLAAATPAGAVTIVVTNTASGTGGAGDCTLAEAIQAANTDTAVDGCVAGSGADIITLGHFTITLLAPFQTDATDGPIGLPDVTSDITILGISSSLTIIEREPAAPDFAIFRVTASGILRLQDVTVRNGRGMHGGAVINRGDRFSARALPFKTTRRQGRSAAAPLSTLPAGRRLSRPPNS